MFQTASNSFGRGYGKGKDYVGCGTVCRLPGMEKMTQYPPKASIWIITDSKGAEEALSVAGGRVRATTDNLKHLIGFTAIHAQNLLKERGYTVKEIITADQE